MGKLSADKIRNIVLLSHGHAGKTALAEAFLYNAGATDRMGRVADGTTVSDYDPEEIKRKLSINATMVPFMFKDHKINLIDTPGYFDFSGEVAEAVRVADGAVIVLSGKSGVAVGTELSWARAKAAKLPVIMYVSKMDDENANFSKIIQDLKDKFGPSIAPFRVPIHEGGKLTGYVNIVSMKAFHYGEKEDTEIPIPASMADEVNAYRDFLSEAVAETSDEMMERYFNGETFTDDEMRAALKVGVKNGDVVPVYGGSSTSNLGVTFLADAFIKYFPSPDHADKVTGKNMAGEEISFDTTADAPLSALVFKTIADPYVGKMSIFRVYSGELKPDTTVYNPNKDINEKIGKVYTLVGKKQTETDSVPAGDFGVVNKLLYTTTGNTLCSKSSPIILDAIEFEKPVLSLAIVAKAKGDEEKISSGLQKLMEEDPTFKVTNNTETHQMVVSGMGDQHLDVIVSKLKTKFGVSTDLIPAKVAYRETIRKKVKVQGRHKKQSGGHGQFGDVWIEFEPGDSEELVFEEKIFGGAVPKNFFPAVEKGLSDCVAKGVLAGYPVVNLKATLVDGSYHPVDSSEMSFKMAATIAYKEGMAQASPVLLEPIGHLEVLVPEDYMGDVIGDITKRRGRVLGMNQADGKKSEVVCEVPMSEMTTYATDLRSMTQARGSFTFEFDHYEQAPDTVAQKVIAEAQKEKAE